MPGVEQLVQERMARVSEAIKPTVAPIAEKKEETPLSAPAPAPAANGANGTAVKPDVTINADEQKRLAEEAAKANLEKDAAAKAQAEAANKEVEAKLREELLQKSIPDFLKEKALETPENKETKEKEQAAAKSEEIEKIKAQYEIFEQDPLLKSIAEWRKNGGTDLNEFVKEVGIVDVKKLTIEDLYTAKGKAHELTGEELTEYVAEQTEKYKELNKVEKKELESKLRSELEGAYNKKAQQFVEKTSSGKKEFDRFYQAEIQKESQILNNKVATMTEYEGFPIDEKIKKELLDKITPSMCEVRDEQGRLVGLSAEKGINDFLETNYKTQIKKSLYTSGWTAGFDAALTERNRVSENPTSQNTVLKTTDPVKDTRAGFNKSMGKNK